MNRFASDFRQQLEKNGMRLSPWLILLCFTVILVIAITAVGMKMWLSTRQTSRTENTYSAAKLAFKQGDHVTALAICKELLQKQKDAPRLLLMAGESASRLKRYSEAIQFYDSVPDTERSDAAIARWAAGEVTLQLGQMSATI